MRRFDPRWIVGKTITDVAMNHFDNGRKTRATSPRIIFEDGSSISFVTQETEIGEYGTQIVYTPAPSLVDVAKE